MAYQNYNTNYKKGEKRYISDDDISRIRKIILEDENAEELVKFSNEKSEIMANEGLTTSQLRNIFGEFRKIEAFWDKDKKISKRRLQLLQPKLAYQQKREEKTSRFCAIMTEAVKDVFTQGADVDKAFRNCMNLMEAIVAYHKFHGGRD